MGCAGPWGGLGYGYPLGRIEGLTYRWPLEDPRNDFDYEDAAARLGEVAANYRSARTLQGTAKWEFSEPQLRVNAQFSIRFDRAGKMRADVDSEEAHTLDYRPVREPLHARYLIGRDGNAEWTYIPGKKLYSSAAYSMGVAFGSEFLGRTAASSGGAYRKREKVADLLLRTLVQRYGEASSFPRDARLEREEWLSIGKEKIACVVVRASGPGLGMTREYWIDKKLGVIRQETTSDDAQAGSSRLQWTSLVLNAPLDQSAFHFSPPPGTRQVEHIGEPEATCDHEVSEINFAPRAWWPGSLWLLDLAFEDQDGGHVKLSDFRNRVAALVFWTSFCKRAVAELADLEPLRKEFEGKDVVILPVTTDPKEIAAGVFAHGKYGTRTLLDADKFLDRLFVVRMRPSVRLLDRKGILRESYNGQHSRAELRAAIQRLLAER